MEERKLARRYAKALYDVSKEKQKVQPVLEDLQSLYELFSADESLMGIFKAPNISHPAKLAIAKKSFDGKVSQLVYRFLEMLLEKNRMTYLPYVFEEFLVFKDKEEGILKAEAKSVVDLSQDEITLLEEKLSTLLSKKVRVEMQKDESLLGGLWIKAGDWVMDESVRGRLERMKEKLKKVPLKMAGN